MESKVLRFSLNKIDIRKSIETRAYISPWVNKLIVAILMNSKDTGQTLCPINHMVSTLLGGNNMNFNILRKRIHTKFQIKIKRFWVRIGLFK